MSTVIECTAPVRGKIDEVPFTFHATGDGSRIVVSNGIRDLIDKKYWNPIQKTCPDVFLRFSDISLMFP
jgi:hypothetical protein